jgi:hypothetical protein
MRERGKEIERERERKREKERERERKREKEREWERKRVKERERERKRENEREREWKREKERERERERAIYTFPEQFFPWTFTMWKVLHHIWWGKQLTRLDSLAGSLKSIHLPGNTKGESITVPPVWLFWISLFYK